jgi:hypothetical protein
MQIFRTLTALGVLAGFATQAHAVQHVTASVDLFTPEGNVNVYDVKRGEPVELPRDTQSTAEARKAWKIDNFPVDDEGWGRGEASAGFGWLRASTGVSASWFQVGSPYGATTYASASYADILTFNHGAPGTTGIVNFALYVNGGLREQYGFDSAAFAESTLNVSVGQSGGTLLGTPTPSSTFWHWISGNEPLFVNDFLNISLRYTVGVPVEMQIFLGCHSGQYYGPKVASGFGSAYSGCSAGHTLTWAGITGAFDEDGNPISVSVSSASGVDYAQAVAAPRLPGLVPEPGTWALLIAGFGATGLALRRQRAAVA